MRSDDKSQALSLNTQDFEAIREAVMETPRGRWFLNEFASRLRSSETMNMLDSMKRLETAVSASHDALMSRLAQALHNDAGAPPSAGPSNLAPKHMKFFKQDEEIFEPAPQAQIAAVAPAPKPEAKPDIARGAKVVIRRTAEMAAPAEPASEQPQAEAAPAPELAAPQPETVVMAVEPPMPEQAPSPQAEAAPKRRIVIIRHKPGEDIDVPLQNEMAEAS
jgi:hypothetical protein